MNKRKKMKKHTKKFWSKTEAKKIEEKLKLLSVGHPEYKVFAVVGPTKDQFGYEIIAGAILEWNPLDKKFKEVKGYKNKQLHGLNVDDFEKIVTRFFNGLSAEKREEFYAKTRRENLRRHWSIIDRRDQKIHEQDLKRRQFLKVKLEALEKIHELDWAIKEGTATSFQTKVTQLKQEQVDIYRKELENI